MLSNIDTNSFEWTKWRTKYGEPRVLRLLTSYYFSIINNTLSQYKSKLLILYQMNFSIFETTDFSSQRSICTWYFLRHIPTFQNIKKRYTNWEHRNIVRGHEHTSIFIRYCVLYKTITQLWTAQNWLKKGVLNLHFHRANANTGK